MSVYLPNGYRLAFNCDSVVPESVARAKAEAYVKKTGKPVYIPGLGVIGGSPAPDPTIGTVSASGADLTGTNLALTVGQASDVTAAFDGDASDVAFKWTIQTGTAVSIVGDSTNRTVKLQGDEEGAATVRCALTSDTASDSPAELTITAAITTALKKS